MATSISVFTLVMKEKFGYMKLKKWTLILIQLNLPLVWEELITLSLKKDNWNPFSEEDLNYYMHLTYRIENEKITEIIP